MKNVFYLAMAVAALLQLSSCSRQAKPKNPDSLVWEARLNDMLPSTMVRTIRTRNLEASIPIHLKDNNGNSLAHASFVMENLDSAIYLRANSDGVVMIVLTKKMVEQNPVVKIRHSGLAAKNIEYEVGGKTVVFKDGKNIDVTAIHYDNINSLQGNGLKLYYTTDSATVQAYLDTFSQTLGFINQTLGKEVAAVSPVLVQDYNLSIIGEPENVALLPVAVHSWKDKHWHFVHESVEYDIIVKHDVYAKNPNLRWLGDGLAEFVSFKHLGFRGAKLQAQMLQNRAGSVEKSTAASFDIYGWTMEDPRVEGYAYSMAFWLKTEERYGLSGTQKFVSLLSGSSSYEWEAVQEIWHQAFGGRLETSHLVLSRNEVLERLGKAGQPL